MLHKVHFIEFKQSSFSLFVKCFGSGSALILVGWIRIRIQDCENNLQKQKKVKKFEVPDVLFRGLEASPVACPYFIEAQGYKKLIFSAVNLFNFFVIKTLNQNRIRVDLKCWTWIRIEINADPKHCLHLPWSLFELEFSFLAIARKLKYFSNATLYKSNENLYFTKKMEKTGEKDTLLASQWNCMISFHFPP